MGGAKTQRSKSFKDIISEAIIDDIDEEDIIKYISLLKNKITIKQYPIKIKLLFNCEFKTPMAFDIVEAFYSHPIQVILTENNLSSFFDELIGSLEAWIDEFQERGSGFIFNKIKETKVKQYKYKYQTASSYIPLQFKSINIINVQNKDNKCLLWAILSKLFPAPDHKQRVTNYLSYEDKIKMRGIEYPVRIKDIPKVEKQNNLSINVFALDDPKNKHSIFPVYISDLYSETVIDLLYIEENGNSHYCLIKNLDSFRCDKNKNKQFTCRNCLQGFQKKETLERHSELCLNEKHCKLVLPKEGKNIVEFENFHFQSKLPIVVYCDFEGTNIPLETEESNPEESYTKKIAKQEINSFGIYVKSDHPKIFKSQYISYVGKDAKQKYVKEIVRI